MAAADVPNSYSDPYWSDLASGVEKKLDLPPGLLVAIVNRGERSNANQVSEAGAKTPFQIIPATRKAAISKYGIDPYLSPQNAAETAGLLLKDSLDRNQGDPASAVAEYHGGTNSDNWGPRTKAYVARVMSAMPSPVAPQTDIQSTPMPASAPAPAVVTDMPGVPDPGQSTFDRVKAALGKPTESQLANVYQAYSSGQMAPADVKQFEADVRAGKIMLPRGGSLNAAAPSTDGPMLLPISVAQAYRSGSMSDADRSQLADDVLAGRVRLPLLRPTGIDAIPGANGDGTEPIDLNAQIKAAAKLPPPPSIGQQIVGAGEAGLNAVTGATGGTIGAWGGLLAGIAGAVANGGRQTGPNGEDLVDEAMAQGANALTYQPRTQAGQQQAAAVGEAMQNALPAMMVAHTMAPPIIPKGPASVLARAGAEGTARDIGSIVSPAAGDAAANAVSNTVDAGTRVADMAQKGITTLPRRALEAVRGTPDQATPTPGTLGSAGAAATDAATQRVATAEGLGFTGDTALTAGQATRDPAQLKFEVETAKMPDEGADLRQRTMAQNDHILSTFDNWTDQTGAEAPSLRAVGQSVDKALVDSARADKASVRAAYRAADQAGEMESPVTLDSVVDHLNESAPDAATAPLLNVARARAVQLGIATDEGGQLVAQPVPLKIAETFRQAIGRATDYEPTNVRQSTIIKGLVDESTAGTGGQLYRAARAARARFAQNYEDRGIVAKLLNNKRGTSDRQVALEDVFDHAIHRGALDDVRNVRRVLQRSGPDGAQAWRELQGQTVRWIRDQATKNVATDGSGNRVISPAGLDKAIRGLDHDGKLEFIFGKVGAQRMRDINDLAQYTRTVPPEAAINNSNTAMTLLAAFGDVGASAFTGVPAPLATAARLGLKHIKDVKLRRRIDDALSATQSAQP